MAGALIFLAIVVLISLLAVVVDTRRPDRKFR
jgi:hypothetical protein